MATKTKNGLFGSDIKLKPVPIHWCGGGKTICLSMAFLGRTEETDGLFPRARLRYLIKDDKYRDVWRNAKGF